MDKTKLLQALSESLREENSIMDKNYELLIEEIQLLTKKINSLYEMMEHVESKYSSVLEDIMARDSFVTADYSMGYATLDTAKSAEPEQFVANSNVVIDAYTNNLAARVNYCMRPQYYDERQRNSDIFGIENAICNGDAERYMVALNDILDKQNESLSVEMIDYISEVIVDLADYVPKEPEKVEETEQTQDNNVGVMFGSHGEAVGPNIKEDNMSSVSVHIEENVNPVTDEITTHYKKLESGIFFADWVNTQKMDYRIKNALSSIDYIIDEVARKPGISIVLDDNNVLGIQTAAGATFYNDEHGGNKVSAFLIDIKGLMDNDIYSPAIIKCYDEVRSVEREQVKSKKKDFR